MNKTIKNLSSIKKKGFFMTLIIISIIMMAVLITYQLIQLIKLHKMNNYDKKLFALYQDQRDIQKVISINFDRLMRGEINDDVYDGSVILGEYVQKEIDNFQKNNKKIIF